MKRLASGGRIDRSRPLRFRWNGEPLSGFTGDTLASALHGAGVDVIGTSVVMGRPRGIMSAGLEEATGFAQIDIPGTGVSEPLVRMTGCLLYEGLSAEGGTRIARGHLSEAPDNARFDKRFAHCEVLVVGAGPAGLAAAAEATRCGARVILVDCDFEPGGSLWRNGPDHDGWVESTLATLRSSPDAHVLTSTTAAMQMDQNGIILAQRVGSLLSAPVRGRLPEQRLWHVRAGAIILATGSLERPMIFQDNDRPGIMLAGGARAYLTRQALAPRRGAVFTTNDDAYRTAIAWHAAGVDVAAVIDVRPAGASELRQHAAQLGIPVLTESVVEGTDADSSGRLVRVRVRTPSGPRTLETDVLAVSGGYEPNINLHLQPGGRTRYDAHLGAAVPDTPLPGTWIVGSARGTFDTSRCVHEGITAAKDALEYVARIAIGRPFTIGEIPPAGPAAVVGASPAEDAPSLSWHVPAPDGDESRSFVDLHRDATVAGVQRAVGAGVTHIEHVKRFTLVGTGTDQGRTARTNAARLTASLTGRPPSDVGVSGSRPPAEPMPFHLFGGRARGERYEPVRTTALHETHVAHGAVFEPAGPWLRPSRYPRAGESTAETVIRECRAARLGAAIIDVSTLGKIDVRGPDAAWFLDQLYINAIGTIPVGRARYSLMCRLDGSIFDDGIVMRTGEQQFLVTASTGHAAAVVDWMEEWLQTEWPDRRVWVTPMTERYTTIAVVGPRSRDIVSRLAHALDVSTEAFPFLAVARGVTVAGIDDALVARVSFSGELAFELSVPWQRGVELWEAILKAGADDDVTPYGLDALQVLRMEKGYIIVWQDTETLTTPLDIGLDWLVSRRKDFVGRRSWQRAAPQRADRPQLTGFVVLDSDEVAPEGAGLTAGLGAPPLAIDGHVTSACWSDALQRSLGLALVRGGRARINEVLRVPLLDGRELRVQLVDPVHYDRAGARRDG